MLEARTPPPQTLAVLGASRRAVGLLEAVAARTPWRVRAASPESHDPREMTDLALRPDVGAILVGAGDPPGPDERGWLDDLAGLVAGVIRRRPEIQVVLAGPVAVRAALAEEAARSRAARDESTKRRRSGSAPGPTSRCARSSRGCCRAGRNAERSRARASCRWPTRWIAGWS